MTDMAIEKAYFQGTGRRKTAVARVRLYPGDGQFIVNGLPVQDYFPMRDLLLQQVQYPLVITETLGTFNVMVKVRGGGMSSQAGAVRHGVARALIDADSELRPPLKQAGMLTRDARVKERKKVGLKRARKRPQYTKR